MGGWVGNVTVCLGSGLPAVQVITYHIHNDALDNSSFGQQGSWRWRGGVGSSCVWSCSRSWVIWLPMGGQNILPLSWGVPCRPSHSFQGVSGFDDNWQQNLHFSCSALSVLFFCHYRFRFICILIQIFHILRCACTNFMKLLSITEMNIHYKTTLILLIF